VNKEKVLAKLTLAWADFAGSFSGLTGEKMLEPGVIETWSVRDIVAHVCWWEEESLKHLPQVINGIRPPRYSILYGGIDAFNAQMTSLWSSIPLEQVLRRSDETHRQLLEYLEGIPGQQFISGTRFLHRLRLDTYGHYAIHTRAIRLWRAGQG
jgi:hypothetical protein